MRTKITGLSQHRVKSFHVHDSISMTTILPGASGHHLDCIEWCHVERCPRLHTLFSSWAEYLSFESIRVFSASNLLMAYCIWGRCNAFRFDSYNFWQLQHIYLYNCPRLVFVLPICFSPRGVKTALEEKRQDLLGLTVPNQDVQPCRLTTQAFHHLR